VCVADSNISKHYCFLCYSAVYTDSVLNVLNTQDSVLGIINTQDTLYVCAHAIIFEVPSFLEVKCTLCSEDDCPHDNQAKTYQKSAAEHNKCL